MVSENMSISFRNSTSYFILLVVDMFSVILTLTFSANASAVSWVHWGLRGALAWKDPQQSSKQTRRTALQTAAETRLNRTCKRLCCLRSVSRGRLDAFFSNNTRNAYCHSFHVEDYPWLCKHKGPLNQTNGEKLASAAVKVCVLANGDAARRLTYRATSWYSPGCES